MLHQWKTYCGCISLATQRISFSMHAIFITSSPIFTSHPSIKFTSAFSTSKFSTKSIRHATRFRKNNIPTTPFISISPYSTPYPPTQPPTPQMLSEEKNVPQRELITYLLSLWIQKDGLTLQRFLETCFQDPTFLPSLFTKFSLFDWTVFLHACYASHRYAEIHQLFTSKQVPWTSSTFNFVLASYFATSSSIVLGAMVREYPCLLNEFSILILSICLLPPSKHRHYKPLINTCLSESLFHPHNPLRCLNHFHKPELIHEIQFSLEVISDCIQTDKPFPLYIKQIHEKTVKKKKENKKKHKLKLKLKLKHNVVWKGVKPSSSLSFQKTHYPPS
ncbi:hypothetical protein HMI56_004328 [Coelomomyces lativittatus]|nr:hypothetical protein HMI56_004328 [Coelomomyces lativittatus]